MFDDDTFEQYSPMEVKQLSGSKKSNSPIDLDDLYDSFIEITKDFDQKLLSKNSRYFSKGIGLPSNANTLIEFIVVGTLKPTIFKFIEQFITKSAYSYSDAFSVLLGLGEIELEESIEALESIGLYKNRIFDYELPLLPRSLAHYLFTSLQYKTKDALGLFLKNEEPASYKLSSFDHRDTLYLKSLLSGWKRSNNKGLNILIYGAVGTGKSELAKSLCSNANLVLMKVKSSSEVDAQVERQLGTRSSTSYRIHNLSMARKLMGDRRDGVLLIDECEDIFDVNMFGSSEPKELLHSLIEEPNSATILKISLKVVYGVLILYLKCPS
ncbi:AAA family ATPase [Pseudoalteromonas rhizosphaerae]|uniref:AAA family ATPase n=1 Tax=Pseudoalteromonas rhizosphaerae TaxID=2518973 RepID=UPI00385127AB